MAAIDGDPKTGWGVSTYGENQRSVSGAALRRAAARRRPIRRSRYGCGRIRNMRRATIGRFRLALSAARIFVAAIRTAPSAQKNDEEAEEPGASADCRRMSSKALRSRPGQAHRRTQTSRSTLTRDTSNGRRRSCSRCIIDVAKLEAELEHAARLDPAGGGDRGGASRARRAFCRAAIGWMTPARSSSRRFRNFSASSRRAAGARRGSIWRTGSSRHRIR